MTVLPWPAFRAPRPTAKSRRQIVDPLPTRVLHSLVADIPGPPGESEAEKSVRFEVDLAEVLALKPRDVVEAMLAVQSVMMRLVRDDARRDAAKPGLASRSVRTHAAQAREFDKLIAGIGKTIAARRTEPPRRMDVALLDVDLCRAMGLKEFLIPDPEAMDGTDEATGGVIVPPHPAPSSLQ